MWKIAGGFAAGAVVVFLGIKYGPAAVKKLAA